MDLGLSDKTALVTGGAGRPGSEGCKHLAPEGATCGITSNVLTPNIVISDLADMDPEQLEQLTM